VTDLAHNQDGESDLPTVEYNGVSGLLWMHAFFFLMALAVIGMSFIMRAEGPQSVFLPGVDFALPELCTAKRVFGVPCPGCGLTRSFVSISHGQFGRAWSFNPASFLLYPFVFAQIPWNAMQFWLIRRRGYGVQVPYIHFIPIAIAGALLLQWLMTMPQLFW